MINFSIITVGLPVYNGEQYLRAAIESVLAQSFIDFEFLISDDMSNDSSFNICSEYAKKDSRIKVFRQKNRLGLRKNHNFVLSKSQTKYFIWINQDDLREKTYLEKLYGLLKKNSDAVLAMSNTTNFIHYVGSERSRPFTTNNKIGKTETYPLQKYTNYETRFESLQKFILSGNLTFLHGMYLTRVLKSIGGYQKSSRPFFKSSDYMTIFRVLLAGSMVFTNEYLFFKRDTGNYLNRFEDLKRLKISRAYFGKVIRYLCFPIFFVYDVGNSIKLILSSDFKKYEKIKLVYSCVVFYVKRNFEYIKSLMVGVCCLCRGIFVGVHHGEPYGTPWCAPTIYSVMKIDKNTRVLAFMNAYTAGKSGGDTAFIQIFKRLNFQNLTVVTSLLGRKLCEESGLKAKYIITTREREFNNIYFIYVLRVLRAMSLICKTPTNDFDLIYSTSDGLPDILPAFLLKLRNTNIKWVVKRFHDIPKTRIVSHFSQKLSLFLMKKADFVIQNGKFGFDHLKIDKISASKQTFDAIFMSRLHPSKGIFDLIEIWNSVCEELPNATLGVIGSGNDKVMSKIKELIRTKNLKENVIILGYFADEKAFSIIKSSKLFLFPSREEAFGLVLGEAMFCKTPVVTFAIPDLKWCETHVFQVPCFEKKYFAKLVCNLLRDFKQRTKNVESAYKFAKSFTWEKAAENEKELINRALSLSRSPVINTG